MPTEDLTRPLVLDVVRVTEAAALRASRWLGRGDKHQADQAAVDAMRGMLDYLPMDAVVVIGEGAKDEAPMLGIGEHIGQRKAGQRQLDIAVDPLDGTALVSKGLPNALCVIALASPGSFPAFPCAYLNKLACGPALRGQLDIDRPVAENLRLAAKRLDKSVSDLLVTVLDRPRHDALIAEIRQAGARIRLISDGDIAGAIATSIQLQEGSGDLYLGVGGASEGVLSAAALKCLEGEIQAKVWWRDEAEQTLLREQRFDPKRVYTQDDLARGDNILFAATGVSGGYLLRGVEYAGHVAHTHSIVMRASTHTVRIVTGLHQLERKTVPSSLKHAEISIRGGSL